MFSDKYNGLYQKALEVFESTNKDNLITPLLVSEAFKKRPEDAYKGSCGNLLVCAGSRGLTGAAVLSCTSAMRGGCGIVTLCCPEGLNDIFEIKLTEVMTKPVPSKNGVMSKKAYCLIESLMQGTDAMLFGPGLSWHKNIEYILKKIITSYQKTLVIDADGLNVISKSPRILEKATCPVIITPHVGEFARLTGFSKEYILNNPEKTAMEFSKNYGVVTVLKSHKTIVTDGESVFTNVLGNPGMATAGSGDVLAGLTASFAAQKNTPLLSALAGVYIHSLAGDMASMLYGEYSIMAVDIAETVSHAIRNSIS